MKEQLYAAALLAASILFSCGESPSRPGTTALRETRKAIAAPILPSRDEPKAPPVPSASPFVEEKPMLVGIESREPSIIFSYSYSNYSYADTYGFNTYVYKFYSDAAGLLVGCIAYELRKDGERERERFAFTRSSDGSIAVESNLIGGKSYGIARKGDSLEAAALDGSAAVFAGVDRGLRLERRYGNRATIEEWPESPDAESRMYENGSMVAKGKFAAKGAGEAVYSETPLEGADAIEYEVAFVRDSKGVAFKTDSAAPLSACLVEGAEKFLSGPRFLESALLLELVIGERGRISPYLAYETLGE